VAKHKYFNKIYRINRIEKQRLRRKAGPLFIATHLFSRAGAENFFAPIRREPAALVYNGCETITRHHRNERSV
jgi:hypothetical protein